MKKTSKKTSIMSKKKRKKTSKKTSIMSKKKRNCCSDLWSHQLQQDIIHLILERLGALDRISFGAVCTCWRAALVRSMATLALPFPFVLHAVRRSLDNTHSLSSLDDDRVYYLNPSNTMGGTCLGIIEGGWLIMYRWYHLSPEDSSYERQKEIVTSYSILNPVTRKEFLLPTRRHSPVSDTDNSCLSLPSFFRVMRASNSELTPSNCSNSEPAPSNCLVAGMSNSGLLVGFCRATDSEWTIINLEDEFKDFECHDIIFCHGKLYALTTNLKDFIIAFDFDNNENGLYKAHRIVTTIPRSIWARSVVQEGGERGDISIFTPILSLATDSVSRELLLIICDVKILINFPSRRHKKVGLRYKKVEVISLSVYRLYMMKDPDQHRGQWIKVTDLGDRILFYGNHGGSFFIPAKVFEESTHQSNCIYYAVSIHDCWDIGQFCLNNQTIIPCPIKRRGLAPARGWFAPQFRKCEF